MDTKLKCTRHCIIIYSECISNMSLLISEKMYNANIFYHDDHNNKLNANTEITLVLNNQPKKSIKQFVFLCQRK